MKLYMKQKPNARILGFWKFHLWLYNLSDKNKENGWLKKIGEAPVIYSPYLTEKTREEFLRYMQNRGFYSARVRDTVLFKKNRKAEVYYSIEANQPTLIRSFRATILDDSLKAVLPADTVKKLVPPKSRFDTDVLAGKTKNVIRYLQNRGFYKLDRNEIYFEADTFTTKQNVDLNMIIDKENVSADPNVEKLKNHERYTIRNFYYYTDLVSGRQYDSTRISNDTIKMDRHYFIFKGKLMFKPSMLINSNHIADQKYYSVGLVERTYNELFSLRLFKSINIRFADTQKVDSLGNPMLDCMIHLSPSMRQAYTVSFEGTNSLGKLGVAGNLGYQHKNLFRGGEIFDVTLLGATEKQSYGHGDSLKIFHSFETGIDTRLTIPKFVAPLKSKKLFQYSTPQTVTDLSYNYQKRPDYTRTILSASLGYQWKSSEYVTHRFNVLDLNMVKMFKYDTAFVKRIENLYIKSSYTDHSISSWNYSYTLNTQNIQKGSDYKFLRMNFETAGNLLYGINKVFNRSRYQSDKLSGPGYHFLGTPFAQYFKTDIEYRKGTVINKYNMFALRGFAGIVVPYGNSDQVPFERKYFTGGANGIRAWSVRTLGPGSWKLSPNEFPNQSGDIKLEANAEYRFAMIGNFEGAFFLDMGNIWSLKDNRQGTEFRLRDSGSTSNKQMAFYKQIAVGTGMGIRYDFSYVILRVDMGIKLHDPSFDDELLLHRTGWIPVNSLLNKDNYNITFAIGYPF